MNTDITNRDLRFLRVAKSISDLSNFKTVHIGAVIVYNNHILSTGYNSESTSPLQKEFNCYRSFGGKKYVIDKEHAEINALRKLPYYVKENDIDLNRACIYIYRENRTTHQYALSSPCEACYHALLDYGVGYACYTTNNGIEKVRI